MQIVNEMAHGDEHMVVGLTESLVAKAVSEPHFSEMYAGFIRDLNTQASCAQVSRVVAGTQEPTITHTHSMSALQMTAFAL